MNGLMDVTATNKSSHIWEGIGAVCKALAAVMSVLSSMYRGVDVDGIFRPWFYYVSSIIWHDWHLTAVRVSDYVNILSECFALGMKLHCPHSHRSMTRNSIEGLVMQRPSNIYIRAGEPHKLRLVGWAGKSHYRVWAEEHIWCLT